ncbi:hypothetical protein ACI2K4_28560 [Micromonospora sp. NPDC050397]|uniref:hypothetical protein n=1 Tax=Micromonospora sp. NPDC050397 TaxID=3364279 RepID=UPI00384C664E
MLVSFWLDSEFPVACRFSCEGKLRQRLDFWTDGLPRRYFDKLAEAVLRIAGRGIDGRSAVIVDKNGRSAGFDWDTVVWRSAVAVPIVPDVMLLPTTTMDRIAPGLGDVRFREYASGFTLCTKDCG